MNRASSFSRTIARSRCGVALITVLILVVLITSVVVGFLATSGLEQTAARSYKATSGARLLADTAVDLVEGQINEATSQGMSYAWASQPGAIRVYNNDGNGAEGTGSLFKIYRLYSALNLTANNADQMDTSATAPGANDMPPASWSSDPAMWVDLNAPAYDEEGNEHYPIFDAGVAANVDGFSLGAPTAGGLSTGVSTTAEALGATPTQVPMPVTWLYVLQNGEIIPPDAGGSTVVQFTHAPIQPSTADPIVGRIAFWTDDDTCKVNINTAGGDGVETGTDPTPIATATFWDTPRYWAQDDITLAQDQPVSGEFQRYPGHPATIALHNILNGLGWLDLGSQQFYSLLPRYTFGGSEGGTIGVTNSATIPLKSDPEDRLYTSVGEMLFGAGSPGNQRPTSAINQDNVATRQQIETASFFLTAHSRASELTLSGQPRVSIWPVMDPAAIHGQQRTPTDKLLAFAATNSGNAYYFTRSDPTSSTTDAALTRNQQLLTYLDYFTSQNIPGYGSNFDVKYTQSGMRQILTEIFDYIRTINIADTTQLPQGTNVPTNPTEYAQTWNAASYHAGLFQVAPSVLNGTSGTLNWGTQGFGIYPRLTEAAIQFVALGRGALNGTATADLAIPLDPSYFAPGIAQTLGLIPAGGGGDSGTDPNDPTQNQTQITQNATTHQWVPPGNTTPESRSGSGSTMAVQAFLLLSFTNPSQMLINDGTYHGAGWSSSVYATGAVSPYNFDAGIYPYVWVEVSGLQNFQLNSHPLGMTKDDKMIIGWNQGGTDISDDWNGVDFSQMLFLRTLATGDAGSMTQYSFFSQIIPITISPATGTGQMQFIGGPITVTLYDAGGIHAVQTYTITFPGTTASPSLVNVPTVEYPTGETTPAAPAQETGPTVGTLTTETDRWSAANYAALATTIPRAPNDIFIVGNGTTGDVVQSMVLSSTWSDPRMLATSKVPSAAFVQDPDWGKQNFAYDFFYEYGPYYNPGILSECPIGILNKNVNYSSTYQSYPVITPTEALSGNNLDPTIADWDTGLGGERDGPWINKADEGILYPIATEAGSLPYFIDSGNIMASVGPGFFSPNREVPSPGMFGSLSTGVDPAGNSPVGWRTLLFRPNPNHEGEQSPRDHLVLDLFWMPVAEPYAISEPFSSAGKINLNYQIEPFTYITRSTALRAVLNSEKIAQVNASQGPFYKSVSQTGTGTMSGNARAALNLDLTLTQFQDKFDGTDNSGNNPAAGTPDIFHSASQICDMYLVPQNTPAVSTSTVQQFATQWNDGQTYGLVGDNVRERPYANIYGQITTKSNTYTVHYTVQSLKNAEPPTQQDEWDETQGAVLGEYRGSTTLERYIDPNQALPDFAAPQNLGKYTLDGSVTTGEMADYKWRVLESQQFAP